MNLDRFQPPTEADCWVRCPHDDSRCKVCESAEDCLFLGEDPDPVYCSKCSMPDDEHEECCPNKRKGKS